jgi:hypothetical protein
MSRKFKNEYTGEINVATAAKFISCNSAIKENKNDTKFRIATVEVVTDQGEVKIISVMMYEKNFQLAEADGGMVKGEKYLLTIAPGDHRGPIATLSHLPEGERLANNDFNFSEISVEADREIAN